MDKRRVVSEKSKIMPRNNTESFQNIFLFDAGFKRYSLSACH